MRLLVHEPQITTDAIVATYTHGTEQYEHRFEVPAPLTATDPTIRRLAHWLATIHACYLFSIDYFDELTTDFPLSIVERQFFEKTIFHGMAEFRYVNTLPLALRTTIAAPLAEDETIAPPQLSGQLLLNGGGKDGLVSATLLQDSGIDFTLFQIGTGAAQTRAASYLNNEPAIFRRIMELRRLAGQYRGHCPTSAAIAISAILTAYARGVQDVIASNESSANEATMTIDGITINHQYSKSLEFEHDLNQLLRHHHVGVRYFSLLRPLHEIQIVKLLSLAPDLATQFISCNHGFRRGFWCKDCAKCAFICLMATALSPAMAEQVFDEPLPINNPKFYEHIAALVDPVITKPLECVGTLAECQAAAQMILQRDLPLSTELRALFERTTTHISKATTTELMQTLGTQHMIPADYLPVLARMADQLA